MVLSLLEESDYRVRFGAMRLVNVMIDNCTNQIQESILTSPDGLATLIDALSDTRDVIKNEVRSSLLSFFLSLFWNIFCCCCLELAFLILYWLYLCTSNVFMRLCIRDCRHYLRCKSWRVCKERSTVRLQQAFRKSLLSKMHLRKCLQSLAKKALVMAMLLLRTALISSSISSPTTPQTKHTLEKQGFSFLLSFFLFFPFFPILFFFVKLFVACLFLFFSFAPFTSCPVLILLFLHFHC